MDQVAFGSAVGGYVTRDLYELRRYTSAPGRMNELVARFRDHTMKLFAEHGIQSIGYWLNDGDPEELVYLVRHEGDPAANWSAFESDPEWQAIRSRSNQNGNLVASIRSDMLVETDFSPMRSHIKRGLH